MSEILTIDRPAIITELPKPVLVTNAASAATAPVRRNSWSMFGSDVSDCTNAHDVMVKAGMNYTVDLVQAQAEIPGFGMQNIPDSRATYRTDNGLILGSVGKAYVPVQNEEGLAVINNLFGEGCQFETAGTLKGGAIAWVSVVVPGHISVKGVDKIAKYLLVVLNHDGKGAVRILFTPVRVICENTLRAALRMQKESGDLSISIRHTASAQARLAAAHEIMGITDRLAMELETIFGTMATTKMTNKETVQYFERVALGDTFENVLKKNEGKKKVGKKGEKDFDISTKARNIVGKMEEYYEAHPTQQMDHMRGTVYGAYQAVTGYFQNVYNHKNAEDMMATNVLGSNAQTMQKAYELAWAAVSKN